MGGAQELPMAWLSRLLGPLEAVRLAKLVLKLCMLGTLCWVLQILALPEPLLLLFSASPTFHAEGQVNSAMMGALLLIYLGFCLAVSENLVAFGAAVVCLAVLTYLGITFSLTIIPAVVALALLRRHPKRALALAGFAGAFLLTRIIVNLANPTLSTAFRIDLVDSPIWMKSGSQVLIYARDLYRLLTLSSAWVDYFPPEIRTGPWLSTLSTLLSILRLLLALMVAGTAVLGAGRSETRKIRVVLGLLVASTLPFFLFGHNDLLEYTTRMQQYFPLAVIALFLGVSASASSFKSSGWPRLARVPFCLLAGVALLSCADWMIGFARTGPPLQMNVEVATRLASHLEQRGVTAPIILNETGALGTLDLFSQGRVRPLYLSYETMVPPAPGTDPFEEYLTPWLQAGRGTLLQRARVFEGGTVFLTRSDLEAFARRHALELGSVEFFPYRAGDGYWIVDFANGKFRKASSGT
jgi:hypothetical protein